MKRIQVVSIDRSTDKNRRVYYVTMHDRIGGNGIFVRRVEECANKRDLIKCLRSEDIEVSKHVENGGKLRLF